MEMDETMVSGLIQAGMGLVGVGAGSWFAWKGEQSRARASRRFDMQNRQHEGMNTLLDEMEGLCQAYKDRSIAWEADSDKVEDPVQLGICSRRSNDIIKRAKRYTFDDSVKAEVNVLELVRKRDVEVASGYELYPADAEDLPVARTRVGYIMQAIRNLARSPEPAPPAQPQPTAEQMKKILPLDLWLQLMVGQAEVCAEVARREINDHVAEPVKGRRRRAFFRFVASAAIGAAVVSGPMLLM